MDMQERYAYERVYFVIMPEAVQDVGECSTILVLTPVVL
jgi:hypothetical protein